ncbi:MAG: hypothetical protein AAF573_09320 [Bacteroidota bacterium]
MVLYLMGLNLSNRQISKELEISEPTTQRVTTILREGIVKKPDIQLEQEVEANEVYIVAGHKEQPRNIIKARHPARPRRLKGARGRGTLATEKPPVLGLVQRNGLLVLNLLPNVQQNTIQPIIEKMVTN